MNLELENTILVDILTNLLFKKRIEDWKHYSFNFGTKLIAHSKSSRIISESLYDISSVLILLRAQLETYSTFYFLHFKGTLEEQKLRHYLWRMDGLKERQKFKSMEDDANLDGARQQLENEKKRLTH